MKRISKRIKQQKQRGFFASAAEAAILEKEEQEPGNPTTDLINSVTDEYS